MKLSLIEALEELYEIALHATAAPFAEQGKDAETDAYLEEVAERQKAALVEINKLLMLLKG